MAKRTDKMATKIIRRQIRKTKMLIRIGARIGVRNIVPCPIVKLPEPETLRISIKE